MIIDCHGHYTTAPKALEGWRAKQVQALDGSTASPKRSDLAISDDELRESLENAQLKLQRERGTDLTLFSPRAMAMAHHIGTQETSLEWSRLCNDLIHRVCTLYPRNFAPVCQLPQSPLVPPASCVPELERCVKELGFVGCNLNPDPSGGHWKDPPLTDRFWYPLYEKLVELDVPAMVHVSASCNPCFHAVGAHYINGDTTAFMQFLTSNLFKDFPTLKFIIPHGGGAVPYHWGRYRGLAQDMKLPPLKEHLLEQRVLRHLRLPPAGNRPPPQGDPRREHPLRLRDGGRRARRRPGDRLLLRRHEALHRLRARAHRRGPPQDLRRQREAGLQPPEVARLSEPQLSRRTWT